MSEGQFMGFSSIHADFGNSLRAVWLASSIFSINIPDPSVGFATHTQAKRVCKLACERVSADCSASVLLRKTRRIARPKYRSASKEYNMGDHTHELASRIILHFGASALRALGASCYARLVSSHRGAICGICPDKRAYRCELPWLCGEPDTSVVGKGQTFKNFLFLQ